MKRMLIAFSLFVLAALACGTPAEEWQLRGWTVTPSLTQVFANTSTPVTPTQTPFIVIISQTPEPTREVLAKCVRADEAVYLRPSPNMKGYPIVHLPNGTKLVDLGGRDGNWIFVLFQDKQGWVNAKYLGNCS